jgi:hypothetical protein
MNAPIITYRANMGVQTTAPFANTYSLDFDGVDDWINCGEIPPLFKNFPIGNASTSPWSASMWVKGSGTNKGFFEIPYKQINSTNSRSFGFVLGASYLYFGGKFTGIKIKESGTTAYNSTEWNHIVMTFDGVDYTALSSYTLYVGGASVGIALITPNIGDFRTQNIAIGVTGSYGGNTYYWDGQIDEVSLFDSELSSVNVSSIYNGGVPNDLTSFSPLAWYRNGDNGTWKSPQFLIPNNENKDKVSNFSFEFDGIDDRIDTPEIDLGLENTISFWAKRNGTNLNGMVWGGVFQSNYYVVYLNNTNQVFYRVGSGANSFTNIDIRTIIGTDAWFHCALVRNNSGADVLCYINGVLRQTITGIVGSTDNTIVKNIGARGPSPLDFEITGFLDELSLFDSSLSASQINDIYNGGEPTTLPSGAVAHYKMGEEANFTSNWLVDNSALTNYSKRSFELDAIDDYIDCGASTLSGETALSISAWIYPTSYGDATAPSFVSTDAASPRAFYLGLFNGTNFRFSLSTNGTSLTSLDTAASTVTLNAWQHILVTWDQVNLKLYKNGVLLKTVATTSSSNGTFTTTNDLLIGARRPTAGLFEGKIDEVSIFNSVVDIADVWDGSGEPIDVSAVSGIVSNYRMGEDASFNGTNWTVPDNVGTSNGTSNAMTVDDLVGEAPNYSGGGISNAMTIEDRVGEAPNSENNVLSYNMDLVDRTTDVPT